MDGLDAWNTIAAVRMDRTTAAADKLRRAFARAPKSHKEKMLQSIWERVDKDGNGTLDRD
eukprot:SAG31_NODE_18085_length_647_cov_1.235401_1_plen_59_part_10